MELTRNDLEFIEDVKQRTLTLCNAKIWDFDTDKLRAWWNNFEADDKHRLLASHMLDRVIFRSHAMAESAYFHYVSTKLKKHFEAYFHWSPVPTQNWLNSLRTHCSLYKIKIAPICDGYDHGGSGNTIIRYLTSDLFDQKYILSPSSGEWESLDNHLVFLVDDFVGSGDQFSKFSDRHSILRLSSKNKVVYAPLLAYAPGQNAISKKYPDIIDPIETLDAKHRFFTFEKGARFKGDERFSEDEVRKWYEGVNPQNGTNRCWYGLDNASLTLCFSWGAPNQSLGAFWQNRDPRWNNLINRRAR